MTSPSKPEAPEDSVTLANLKAFSVKTEDDWKAEQMAAANKSFSPLGGLFRDDMFKAVGTMFQAAFGYVFGEDGDIVDSLVGNLLGLTREVELHTQEIVKLDNVAPLEGTVPAWVSVDLQDMPSVPRTMLRPRYAGIANSTPQFGLPSETPAWRDAWLAPIVADREATVDRFKIITGAQTWSWGGRVDYWELGLYRLDEATQTLQRAWSSGNVVTQLSAGAKEYSLPTGQQIRLVGGEVWFAAQLQTTNSGASSAARTLMVQQNSTLAVRASSTLKAACYGLSNQAALPASIPLNSMWVIGGFTPYMGVTTVNGTEVVPL